MASVSVKFHRFVSTLLYTMAMRCDAMCICVVAVRACVCISESTLFTFATLYQAPINVQLRFAYNGHRALLL